MRQSTFAQAGLAHATAAFNRVFEAYVVPMVFSESQLAIHLDANQIDGNVSPIWYDEDGNVLAAATLAIRGSRGWIGGFGVALPYRGRKYGARLIDQLIETARSRGLSSLSLEVLEQNHAAVHTYERAGFARERELLSFRCEISPPATTGSLPAYTSADPLLRLAEEAAPCWQREPASLMLQPSLHAVGDAARFAVFRHNGIEAQILKIRAGSAGDVASLAAGIGATAGVTCVGVFNEPSDSAIVAHLRELGWTPTFKQYEMHRREAAPDFT
ncbi:MAG: GNAT family N-acetyltransferase [Vulcanimicrobiaceae bacterium]